MSLLYTHWIFSQNKKIHVIIVIFLVIILILVFSIFVPYQPGNLLIKFIRCFVYIVAQKQKDLLDLTTALLKFTCFSLAKTLLGFLALQSQRSAHSKAVLDESLTNIRSKSLYQHELYYCTIALKRCEIYDDVMVLIWKFGSMGMNETKGNE